PPTRRERPPPSCIWVRWATCGRRRPVPSTPPRCTRFLACCPNESLDRLDALRHVVLDQIEGRQGLTPIHCCEVLAMAIQRLCKALKSATLFLMLLVVGFTRAGQLRAESPKPTRFNGTPVTITPPQESAGPVYLHLRLRMDDGVCKVSRRTADGGY